MLIDTHCHIHESNYPLDAEDVLKEAQTTDVKKMICVGTTRSSSVEAIAFAEAHAGVFASIGVHPHDTKDTNEMIEDLVGNSEKIVAVGEIGLDYFYNHSDRDAQINALERQLQLAQDHNLPVIFHVREAFDDFWPIFDNFNGIRGVLHSFTDTKVNVQAGLRRNLYFGINGISTFTKDAAQQEMFRTLPLENVVLETDAPFLTPSPFRGKVNKPSMVREVAKYNAEQRNIDLATFIATTSMNAQHLFHI